MSNILYIDHYAGGPRFGMEYRPHYLAKEWVKAGHAVTIVAASFAHTRHTQPRVEGLTAFEEIDGIRYVWIRTPPYEGNGIGRIRNMAAFIWGLYRHLPAITHGCRPDAVIASSTYPLDFYPARRIARKNKARLVFELHDLWPMSPMELGGMSRFHPFIQVMQRAEDAWCRGCDAVVSILPHADSHLQTRGLKPQKFIHIPNGIDPGEWKGPVHPLPTEHQAFLDESRARGRFLVGYAGAHGVANALDFFIKAGLHLKDFPIDLVLVGNGPERAKLVQKASDLNLSQVSFLGPIPKAAIPSWLTSLDALYIGLQRCPLFSYGVSPNKLFDYMMAGKPIIYAIDSSNVPVRDALCGVAVPAENSSAIADGILQLHRTDPVERETMGYRGRAYILANHTYPVLARRFLDVLLTGASHD